MSLCSLTDKINVPAPVEKVFHYFTDTDQIVSSFPPSMKFKIVERTCRHLSQGSCMEFQVDLLYVSTRWKSHVHSFSQKRHITCIWRSNSYTSFEQDYYFESITPNQTRITECILYRMPLGKLGTFFNSLLIAPYFRRIMKHRQSAMMATFSNPKAKET